MPYKVLDDNNSDGVVLGQSSTAKIGFYGGPAIPQRSVPMEANIQGLGAGQLVTLSFTWTPITNVPSYNAVECIYPVTITGATSTNNIFCVSTDFLLAVNKPTCMTYFGIGGFRICSPNVLAVNFVNSSAVAGTVAPGGEVYSAVIAQGLPIITQALTPAGCPCNANIEQTFTLGGINAAGTAIINNAGQVVGINITTGGSNYFAPPAITLTGGPPLGGINAGLAGSGPLSTGIIGGAPNANPLQAAPPPLAAIGAGDVTGTWQGLNYPAATAQYPYGSGATAIAVVSGGAVVGAVVTAPGSGYQIAPSVTFMGGNTFSPGMVAHYNKTSTQSGLGIGNVRVVGPYQIGITYINCTAAWLTPASEQGRFLVTNEFPAVNNVVNYCWNAQVPYMTVTTGAVSQTCAEFPVTMPGIQLTDIPFGFPVRNGAAAITNLVIGGVRVAVASVLEIQCTGIGTGVTLTANDTWIQPMWKQQPVPPSQLFYPYLTFANSITAAGTFEVTQTVTGVNVGTAVVVNKPTMTTGIVLLSSRVSAANQIAMSFQNYSSSAVSLPSEFYTVENFQLLTPGQPGGGTTSLAFTIQSIDPVVNQLVDLGNELRDSLYVSGFIKGS